VASVGWSTRNRTGFSRVFTVQQLASITSEDKGSSKAQPEQEALKNQQPKEEAPKSPEAPEEPEAPKYQQPKYEQPNKDEGAPLW